MQKYMINFFLLWLPQLTKSMGLDSGLHRGFRRDPDAQKTNADQGCAKYESGPATLPTVRYIKYRSPNIAGENSNKITSTVLTK
jgi:hypothetical protein